MKRFYLLWLMIGPALFCLGAPGQAEQAHQTTVTEVARELVCDCPDCGKQSVDQCVSCDVSRRYRAEIAVQIKQGRTKDQILEAFADKYGEKLLGNPRPRGVNRMAPLVPVMAVAVGLLPLGLILRSRRGVRVIPAAATIEPNDGAELDKTASVEPHDDEQLEAALRRYDF